MAQRQAGARRGGPEGRLGVLPGGGAGGRVPRVADGEVAAQAAQRRLVEDLADQPEVLVDHDRRAVGDRDPGRLLTAVLQRVQAEIGQLRDLLPRRPDAEDAAGVLGAGEVGVEVVRQPSITAGHVPTVPGRATVPEARGVTVTTAEEREEHGGTRTEEGPMPSDRPDPGEFLEMAQRMLRELFGGSSGEHDDGEHDDGDPWGRRPAGSPPRGSATGNPAPSGSARTSPSRWRPAPSRRSRISRSTSRRSGSGSSARHLPGPTRPSPGRRAGSGPDRLSGRLTHTFGSSAAIVVSSPCPVCTTVSPGRVSSRVLIDSRIVGRSLKVRPVAPGPPWNSVSPVKTVPSSGA